jgi:D-tyrosyl-tRNA(Tyr) deacylase
MKALIQRVRSANVVVDQQLIGSIEQGLLVLLAVESHDKPEAIEKMAHKLLNYRLFSDDNNKMNLSIQDIQGEILVVSQFTLAANTDKGLRPSFSCAADPAIASDYYERCVEQLKASSLKVETGKFAADMQVSLVNDGPVTFMLET